jgi:hypothetical protein
MGRGQLGIGVMAVLATVTIASRARADAAPASLFSPTESTPSSAAVPAQPVRVTPFGPSPAPRVVLFPVMRTARPADVPPPKPTKGLALVFDW